MKKIKRILAGAVSAALLVSALAIPTEATITTTPTTKSKSGTYKLGNRTYSYGGTLTASTTQASAAASSGHSITLGVKVAACGMDDGLVLVNQTSDAIADTRVSIYVNNIFTNLDGKKVPCDITQAQGTYRIGAIDNFSLAIT